jgi:hypothetical protein
MDVSEIRVWADDLSETSLFITSLKQPPGSESNTLEQVRGSEVLSLESCLARHLIPNGGVVSIWRGGRAAEGNGLLNRHRAKSPVAGSNPALSATQLALNHMQPLQKMRAYRQICRCLILAFVPVR